MKAVAAPQELWLSRTASTAPIRISLSVGRVKVLKVNKYPDPSLLTFCWLNSSGIQRALSWVIESINFSVSGTEYSREG